MLQFNKDGNLSQNLNLSFREFKEAFGYNAHRNRLIEAVFDLLKALKKYGTISVYIAGSFVTNKEKPGDLDLCWDITGLHYKECKKDYPEFFNEAGIERLRLATGIHIACIFDSYSTDILDWFQFDRNGKKRGWVKISLFNLNTT